MPKSVLDIEVNDKSFNDFAEKFAKYQTALAKMPGAWNTSGKAMAAALMAQTDLMKEQHELDAEGKKKAQDQAEKLKHETQATAMAWQEMGRHTKTFALNIANVTTSLLKWSALTSVFTGLLGVGGLFGLDRLAFSASASRRSAQGLGISIGQQKAFGLAYGTVVDPSKLGEIQEAQSDLSRRGAFAAMGIGNPEGMDTAALTIRMMERAKQMYRPGMSQQEREAMGFGQFFSLEDLNRINRNDLGAIGKQYQGEIGRLGYSDKTAGGWQDLMKQLQDAGGVIEKVLIQDLEVLAPQIKSLSKGVVDLVAAVGESPKVKEWLTDLAGAFEDLAMWLHESGLHGKGGQTRGVTPAPEGMNSQSQHSVHPLSGLFGDPHNNPGKLEHWDPFLRKYVQNDYASTDEGLRSMASQLRVYGNRDNLHSIESIVSKWAPPSENDTESYIKDVSQRTGYGRKQWLDLSDTNTLENLMSAMTKHEDRTTNFTPMRIDLALKVENASGTNLLVNGVAAGVTGYNLAPTR